MKRATFAFILFFILASLSAHPWKPRHYVIVDTDGGVDDRKAICLLLASPDVRILAITVSDGFHKSPEAYSIVRSMLDDLWHEGLPMASGTEAITLIDESLNGETSPVTFIALGSLETAAKAMAGAPSFTKKIKQIKKMAELYLFDKKIEEVDCRFDVVAIVLGDGSNPTITHYENAFY